MTCNNCGKPINRGKWCSDKCRKAFERGGQLFTLNPDKIQPGQVIVSDLKPQADKSGEWFNSAVTKTQAEIEAHYTLANFPPVKYYSINGGGAGSYSPYPARHPRSAAYIVV